ncbi:hypothetical protein FRC09_013404 [Ceratobasidium sp. 395]|nr:hypothetical protein FRC09_013404 [Ceratobasidium sp. 395]
MTISVKALKSHLKAAITRLAYDARAVFTHQIPRRHLYALAICGSEATFVRFDRAGVLYSPPIDVCGDFHKFTGAVAALLMMNNQDFGFDTAFITRMGEKGRLDYYVDLPESTSPDESKTIGGTSAKLSLRRFKVVECLCNRGDIVGRATIVLRVRKLKLHEQKLAGQVGLHAHTRGQKRSFEQSQPEELCDESFVLKLVWRDPSRDSEGDILERLVGIYGLVQYVWHYDVLRQYEATQIAGLLICKNLVNIRGAIRVAAAGRKDQKYKAVNTDKLEPTSETRERRIYSRILFSSCGKPLREAASPRELLMGMLDAVVGYWHLSNKGILHRDVSDGNVMLLAPGQDLWWGKSMERPRGVFKPSSESETKLGEYLKSFDRDPVGMLSDFDMYKEVLDVGPPGSSKTGPKGPRRSARYAARKSQISSTCEIANMLDGKYQPHTKRRKLGHSYVPTVLVKSKTAHSTYTLRKAPPPQTLIDEKHDYRIGTVAFMSVNVLSVRPGQKYHHSFMDDLESFFWVLLYTIAGHTNPGTKSATPAALKVVDQLDLEDMDAVYAFKVSHLNGYSRGLKSVTKAVCEFGNDWACNKHLVSVLIQLGTFFHYNSNGTSFSDLTPAVVFPKILDIFMDALQKM